MFSRRLLSYPHFSSYFIPLSLSSLHQSAGLSACLRKDSHTFILVSRHQHHHFHPIVPRPSLLISHINLLHLPGLFTSSADDPPPQLSMPPSQNPPHLRPILHTTLPG